MKIEAILLTLTLFGFSTMFGQNKIDPEEHRFITTDRQDGRYLSSRGFVQFKMQALKPKLAFDPLSSKAEFMDWKDRVRIKLKELMKFPVVAAQPKPKLLQKEDRDGYRLEKWEMYPQPGSVVPYLVLIPNGVSSKKPAPAVLCYPGSNRTKENLAGEHELVDKYAVERHYEKNEMAKFYVEQGMIAIALDNPGIGELSDLEYLGQAPNYERNSFSRYLLDMGWHYLGLSAFHGQAILDWAKTLDFVDPKRLALSGHSLGTEPVMVLGVLNPDLCAIVFNDFLTNTSRRIISQTKPDSSGRRPVANWLGHCVPGLWEWFDYADLLASIAPTPLIITEGGVTTDLHTVQNAYHNMNSADNFTFNYYIKYRNSDDRKDSKGVPNGLAQNEFFEFANVDAPNHYFKSEEAVPWLKDVLFR